MTKTKTVDADDIESQDPDQKESSPLRKAVEVAKGVAGEVGGEAIQNAAIKSMKDLTAKTQELLKKADGHVKEKPYLYIGLGVLVGLVIGARYRRD